MFFKLENLKYPQWNIIFDYSTIAEKINLTKKRNRAKLDESKKTWI